jgi:hypothetical protein
MIIPLEAVVRRFFTANPSFLAAAAASSSVGN